MHAKFFTGLLDSPKKFKAHFLKVLALGFFVALAAAFFIDQRISQFFGLPENHKIWWLPARELTDIGLSENYFGIALVCWVLTRWITPRMVRLQKFSATLDYYRRWSLNFLMALIISGLFVHLIKGFVGRQRPHKSLIFDPLIFDPITTHWHWHSFPSGHSQVMITAATMFSLALPKWRWLWIALAVGICCTRIIVLDHFLSDTIFGGTVGYLGTLIAVKWMKDNTSQSLF
jgi:membrane-associated phospholipid phosphatase